MTQIFDEQKIQEQCTCLDCGWEGFENELKSDEYDPYNCSMVIAANCPVCGSENLG